MLFWLWKLPCLKLPGLPPCLLKPNSLLGMPTILTFGTSGTSNLSTLNSLYSDRILRKLSWSYSQRRLITFPFSPALAVLPILWICSYFVFAHSKLIIVFIYGISNPLLAIFVETNIYIFPFLKSCNITILSWCIISPCNGSTFEGAIEFTKINPSFKNFRIFYFIQLYF